jgi:hypothetical protein
LLEERVNVGQCLGVCACLLDRDLRRCEFDGVVLVVATLRCCLLRAILSLAVGAVLSRVGVGGVRTFCLSLRVGVGVAEPIS